MQHSFYFFYGFPECVLWCVHTVLAQALTHTTLLELVHCLYGLSGGNVRFAFV